MLSVIFLAVACLVSMSFKMEMVEMLSELKMPSPFLQTLKPQLGTNLTRPRPPHPPCGIPGDRLQWHGKHGAVGKYN